VSGVATAPRATPRERGEASPAGARRTRLWLAVILAVALVLRLAWSLYAARVAHVLNDPFSYLEMGKGLAAGKGYRFPIDATPTAYFPIGYPAFVAVFAWINDHTPLNDIPRTVGVVQAFLGTASVWLVWRIAARVFGTTTGLVAAAVTAVFPGLLLYSAPMLSETLYVVLELAAIAVILDRPWDEDTPSWRRIAAFGVLTALTALVRPQAILLVVALAIGLVAARFGWRRGLAAAGVSLAVALVCIAPWTARNAVVMHAFIPISTNTGDDLCMGHNPQATGAFALYPGCLGIKDFRGGKSEVKRDRDNTHKALKFAWEHPRRELHLATQRIRYTYDGDYEAVDAVEGYRAPGALFLPDALRGGLKHTADGYLWVVLLFALISIPMLASRRDGRSTFLLAATLMMAFVPVIFFGDVRFHVPASPLFAIAAAVALLRLAGRLRRRAPAAS
jgi:4-amino-4-deoxy-L-arabinose transferase-like glycosyltransferase